MLKKVTWGMTKRIRKRVKINFIYGLENHREMQYPNLTQEIWVLGQNGQKNEICLHSPWLAKFCWVLGQSKIQGLGKAPGDPNRENPVDPRWYPYLGQTRPVTQNFKGGSVWVNQKLFWAGI